jgi:hypothetical protein
MKLSIALVTALLGIVAAIPADPFANVSMADRSVDLLTKRDCASGYFCTAAGEKRRKYNQGLHVSALSLKYRLLTSFTHTTCLVYMHVC